MAPEPGARWLTTKEAAAILRVHPKHVYRLLKLGLPASRVGGQWRFHASEIQAWSRDGRQPGGYEEQQVSTCVPPALIAAGDEPVVELLLGMLKSSSRPCIGRVDHLGGILPVLDGSVMACVIAGDLPEVPASLLARVHLAHAEFGLATLAGEAPVPLSGLGRRQARLASWPPGSDLRTMLDGVLAREGVDSRAAHHLSVEIRSHADAVAAVVVRRAEATWTSAAWAARFGLRFVPLASRSLALIVRATALAEPNFVRCWEVLQSASFREAVAALPGHDPAGAGEIRYLPRSAESPSGAGSEGGAPPRGRFADGAQRKRPELRCAFITRGHGQDASDVLLRVVRTLQKRGIALCGCVQVPRRARGRLSGYDLVRVGESGALPLARREPSQKKGFSAFHFDDSAFQVARSWIDHGSLDARIAVIDSLGALEAKGEGHFEALAAALGASVPGLVIASARRDVVASILHRLGLPLGASLRLDLPCDAQAEKRFVDAIARRAGA